MSSISNSYNTQIPEPSPINPRAIAPPTATSEPARAKTDREITIALTVINAHTKQIGDQLALAIKERHPYLFEGSDHLLKRSDPLYLAGERRLYRLMSDHTESIRASVELNP